MHALFRTFLPRILVSYFHYGKKTERINLFISCYNTFQKLESEAFYNRAKCNPNNPNSNLDKSTLTLNEWYSFGIQNYKNGVVKPSTIQNYCCIYNNHIKKFLGYMPLCEIRTMHIQQMHNSLELSSKYQHCIHAILSNMFEIAVQNDFDQLISTLSPNGILLNSCQLNPPLSITETTYIDCFSAFADFSLLFCFFG